MACILMGYVMDGFVRLLHNTSNTHLMYAFFKMLIQVIFVY